jgi:mannitol-1-phosphate 5-dehydrogenase
VALTGKRTYVGFGLGPIQAGLFLFEAFRSGNFGRLVVAEVLPHVVSAVRQAGGCFAVNIAHSHQVEIAEIGPVEIEDPASEPDRNRLVRAVAEAEEIATAVPSIQHYASAGLGSIHRILAEGLRKKATAHGPRAIIYAAENHNHAAEILRAKVLEEVPEEEHAAVRASVQFLNTVIGKMSGVVSDAEEVRARGLATITPEDRRAFLVEAFNRILISKVSFNQAGPGLVPAFRRGITVFEEKPNLLPFEEAKLYGHNATHALAAYVGALRGVQYIRDLAQMPDMLAFLRAAFIQESGEALIRKYAGVDSLFTRVGYREYADDLLARMTNPYLGDTVERVGRDPERKLGWEDRLVGTMRVALREGVPPLRYAFGAAAALAAINRSTMEEDAAVVGTLEGLWGSMVAEKGEKEAVLRLVLDARRRLKRWCEAGFPDLEGLFPS